MPKRLYFVTCKLYIFIDDEEGDESETEEDDESEKEKPKTLPKKRAKGNVFPPKDFRQLDF